MRRALAALFLLSLLGCAFTLLAQSESAEANPAPDAGTTVEAQIQKLLAMSTEKRRAYLKALAPEERRGLWMKVKQADFKRRNGEKASYKDLKGFPVDAGGWKSAKKVATKATVGTITYDSGFPTTAFGGGELVGNHFDTHTGIPVCNPGTISTIQALVVPGPANTTSSAGFVILGPQTTTMTMGGAAALFSTFTAATGVIDSISFAGLGVTYTGSDFFVLLGDFANSYVPVVGTGSTLGQGHHAVVGYTGMAFPNITRTFDFGNVFNSFVRARGVIVPVELMKFEVD